MTTVEDYLKLTDILVSVDSSKVPSRPALMIESLKRKTVLITLIYVSLITV